MLTNQKKTITKLSRIFVAAQIATAALTGCGDDDQGELDAELVEAEEALPGDLPVDVDPADEDQEGDLGNARTAARVVTAFPTRDDAPDPGAEPTGEDGEVAPALLEYEWVGMKNADTPRTLSKKMLALKLTNATESTVDVVLELVGDGGTTTSVAAPAGSVTIDSGESVDAGISLDDLGIDIANMPFAGEAHVVASVYDADSGEQLDMLVTESLYFHGQGNAVFAYPRDVLRDKVGGGDYKNPSRRIDVPEEDAVDERVVADGGDDETGAIILDTPDVTVGEVAGFVREAGADTIAANVDPKEASTYTLCVRYEVTTTDSGFDNSVGITEDWWSWANSSTAIATAYGVRVKVGSTTFDTSPSNGCVTFSSSSSVHDVRVYAFATDSADNYARIHNASPSSTSSYPGSTYSAFVEDVQLVANGTKYLNVGDHTPRWTAMGAMAVSMYRYHDGVSDAAYHVSDQGDCADGNANYSNSVANNRSYIRLQEAGSDCPNSRQNAKFIVGHEYGHAYGYQFAERNSTPSASSTHNATPSSCGIGSGYSMTSKEWSSLSAREAFAHFVSAKIWNNKAGDGQFRWFNVSYDLERWNAGNTARGRLRNQCCSGSNCASSLDGAATNNDWMLGFWDMYTNGGCSNAPSKTDMARLWSKLINSSGLAVDNYWPKSQSAAAALVSEGHIGSCFDDLWDEVGCHNGMDFQGSLPSGGC